MEHSSQERITEAGRLAREHFQNYNCAESVLLSFLDRRGSAFPPQMLSVAGGFGGGMGGTGNACGAVTGALMALGTLAGRHGKLPLHPTEEDLARPKEARKICGRMVDEITNRYGTIQCRELLHPGDALSAKEKKGRCADIVEYCAALAERYAQEWDEQHT